MNEEERANALKNIQTAVAMYHSCYGLIETFEKQINGTKEEQNRAKGFFLGGNILGAFGIENALKALIWREGKNPKNIHNLRKLYDKLVPATQQLIREKITAIDIWVNGKVMRIRVEGVIDEHQESFQDWRYKETEKSWSVVSGVLPATLLALIQTHSEKYGEDIKREEKQGTSQTSPPAEMIKDAIEYYNNVLMPTSGG